MGSLCLPAPDSRTADAPCQVRQHGSMDISSSLVDAHLYVFSRQLLSILEGNAKLQSISQDLLPYLTQQQLRLRPTKNAIMRANSGIFSDEVSGAVRAQVWRGRCGMAGSAARLVPGALQAVVGIVLRSHPLQHHPDTCLHVLVTQVAREMSAEVVASPLPGDRYMDMSHTRNGSGEPGGGAGVMSGLMRVHVVDPSTTYCARVCDVRRCVCVCVLTLSLALLTLFFCVHPGMCAKFMHACLSEGKLCPCLFRYAHNVRRGDTALTLSHVYVYHWLQLWRSQPGARGYCVCVAPNGPYPLALRERGLAERCPWLESHGRGRMHRGGQLRGRREEQHKGVRVWIRRGVNVPMQP